MDAEEENGHLDEAELARAELVEALRARRDALDRLTQLQRQLTSSEDPSDVARRVTVAARELLSATVATLRLKDPEMPDTTRVVAFAGDIDPRVEGRSVPMSAGIGGRAIGRDAVIASEPGGHEQLLPELEELTGGAALAAPIHDGHEAVGVLTIADVEARRSFGERHREILSALAGQVGIALGHRRTMDSAVHEALHDPLTGLPNRSLLIDRMQHALARTERTGTPLAVLVCDIHGFARVNNSLGHAAGDEVLAAVAERVSLCLRPSDTVARLGGDEFAVLLEELREPGDAARAARRILGRLSEPFEVAGRRVKLAVSVGISAAPGDPDSLLRDASLALGRAKQSGGGRYAVFEPQMHTQVVERLELELDLRRAIESGELTLHYQPIVELESGRIVAMESLARWLHPTRGAISPLSFIPLAEETGQIVALGRWAIASACHRAALWRARYPAYADLRVGVNVSATQLHEPGIIEVVESALAEAQLEPDGLVLEITETVLMHDFDLAAGRLERLKELGVMIAIDDFGTGYSSLRYLRRLPLDTLKIDRSFVGELGTYGEPALVKAIVDLAGAFGLAVVGEGIERPEQRRELLALGCALGQGNLFSEALPADRADSLLLEAGLLGPGASAGDAGGEPAQGGGGDDDLVTGPEPDSGLAGGADSGGGAGGDDVSGDEGHQSR